MARGKRDTRFATLRTLFSSHRADLMDLEVCKKNVEMCGYVVYETEIEKFAVENPDIDIEQFVQWLKDVNALKIPGKKSSTGGSGNRNRSINTVEKAEQVGVAPENVEKYLDLVNQIFALKDELAPLCTNGVISFAIPLKKEKAEPVAQ